MNIHELDSYDLGDAVKFNDRLNPRIWGADEKMRPEVREQLLRIADDFREFLGIDVEIKDITVSGSNAAYTYTPHSDIDLHLVVDLPKADASEVYRELFDAKKYAYNDMHNIQIGGYDVELYVQDANKQHHSQGIYSIMNDDWVAVPRRRRPDVDDISVKSKFEDLGHRIETAIKSQDYEKISAMAEKIRDYRQAGLDAHGEFGAENLAFKILRTQGLIKQLYDARAAAKDELLSLDERRKKKKKKSVRYGYGGYWYPGTAYAGQDHPAGTEGGDGGGDGGGESIRESVETADEDILRDFIRFCVKELKIEQMPRVRLRKDPQWSQVHKTFGRYNDDANTLEVAWGQRHIMDVLRTVAHELTHKHQHEREGEQMGADAGETGSPYENEANARAGVLMRDYGRLHPEYFSVGQVQDLEEGASGYIPTRAQAKDPRFSMALTVDVKPGQVGKEANKLKLKTNRQGQPQIARANGLFENLFKEYKQYKAAEDYSPDAPPGPEFRPTMPAGTLRVGVSDVYDWYKLGQHISNMKGLGKHDFGAGPPGAIISFGDEETEHKFIQDLEATGLGVTDIDPVDPKQPAGMRKVKTDPTYNVDEVVQAPISKTKDAEQYYKFILAKHKMGRPLTRGEQDYVKMYQMYRQQKLAEFAPTPDRNDNDDIPDQLVVLANRWWNATDRQPQIEHVLNSLGWSIHQVESEDDAVQLQHRDGTTYFISADDFDPDLFEIGNSPEPHQPNSRRKNSLFHAEVDGQWVDVFFDRSELNDTLHITFTVNQNHEPPDRGSNSASKSTFRILSTVRDVIKQNLPIYMKKGRPPSVSITSKGDSRTSLYRRYFVPVIQDILGPDWQMTDYQTGGMTVFNWKPINKLDEISDELRRSYLGRAGQQVDRRQTRMAQARERLNKGYEIYHAEDPTRIVHRFEANTPADARRYYEKFITRYESDRDFDLQLRRATGLMESEEDLDEVKMSPGALEKFATSDAAKGIRAGFEAELIFRDTQGSSDDIDPEPNYDADERAYSISQVIEFFTMDEYGYGLSDRERNRLEENLDEAYMEWRDSQMTDDFRNEAEDLVREVHLDEVPLSERIIRVLTDGMEIDDAEADKILAMGVDAPKFNTSKEQQAYAEQNPGYKIYLEALDDAEAILDEEVETSIKKQDGYYDQALDDYRDNWAGDDDSFFSDIGLRWMSDIANEYGLDWPVWDMDNQRNNGSRSWEDIGAELQAVVDMPVVVSDNYHSTRRRPGQWIIEPDGSLGPDDQSEEAGLEIVSPPMPLLTAIEKLKQVTDWANDPQGGNAYTNGTTGLHMGVSLPRFTSEDADSDAGIDYVKLILFMGDKYVQQQFGRTANTYCASALDKLKQNIKGKRSDPAGVVTLLRHGLTELAQRELQKGVGTSKYTSAHIQDGYIEFRSPGGDWLAKSDEEIGILENTMLRFARAMAIAGDPSAERQEYAKKLYKLVTEGNDEYADQLRLFSEYSAGTIDKEQLKKQWAEKTIGKEKETNQRWKLYQMVNGTWTPVPGGEWNGYTEDQVKNAVWGKYGREALDTGEYQLVNMGEQDWEVYDVKTGKMLEIVKGKSRGEVADAVFDKYANQGIGFNVRPYEDSAKLTPRAKLAKRIVTKPKTATQYNYDIVDQRTVELRVVDQFRAETPAEAERVYSAWLKSKDLPDDTANYGYRKNEQAADDQRDSVDIQRTLGIQDVDTDVAQNFSPDYSAFERNSDRIDAIRARQDATDVPRNWEFVNRINGQVIHNMTNASYNQANVVQNNLESRYPDADIYLRSVERSN